MVEPQSLKGNQLKSTPLGSMASNSSRMTLGLPPIASTSGRLESFRSPRDLSLSTPIPAVNKPPKRKFEPIIPSAKKPKLAAVVPVKSSGGDNKKNEFKDKKKKGGHGNFRGQNRPRGSQYVQTLGVTFGEMEVLPMHRIKERYDSKVSATVKKKVEVGPKPYFNEEELDQQHELEADDLIRSMKHYNIDEPKVKPRRGDAKPVIVPFRKRALHLKQEFIKSEIKEEKFSVPTVVNGVKIKQEVKEEVEELDEKKPFPLEQMKQSDSFYNLTALSISEILQQPSGSMFILQMPDSLPGHVEADPSRRSVPCTLKDLGEGPLGKLEFMTSGRVRLNFGNERYMYLEAGTSTAVRQEVVSVDVDPETKTGSMKVLGEVKGLAICSPDWDSEIQYILSKNKAKS
ncbi:hypothetical protein B566_EDAN000956 [Ephemera danica]|nr:hypothetical protein B566_EDAN000956 [Ephemera danica]